MTTKFGKLSGVVTGKGRWQLTSCESGREMGRMAQALHQQRLKIEPVVYALSALQPNRGIFSHIREISGKLTCLSQDCWFPDFLPPCVPSGSRTRHGPDRTWCRTAFLHPFHCVLSLMEQKFYNNLHCVTNAVIKTLLLTLILKSIHFLLSDITDGVE